MAKYRAALIGCGGKGRDHTNTLMKNALVDLVALCDIREEALQTYQEMFGVSALYTDYQEMFERENLALVVISTQAPPAPRDNACRSSAWLQCALRKTDGCDASGSR